MTTLVVCGLCRCWVRRGTCDRGAMRLLITGGIQKIHTYTCKDERECGRRQWDGVALPGPYQRGQHARYPQPPAPSGVQPYMRVVMEYDRPLFIELRMDQPLRPIV